MATLQVFGVDKDLFLEYLPQIEIQDDSTVTSINEIIKNCAAEILATFIGCYGDYIAEVYADSNSVTYKSIQRCIIILCKPDVYIAAFMNPDTGLLESMRAEVEALRERMRKNPRLVFGFVVSSTGAPDSVMTSTSGLGLEVDDYSLANRRVYDSRTITSKEGRFYW
jgi:hypothetical protein